jgi:hypothetical protein
LRSPAARTSDVASIIEPPRDELFLDLFLNQLEPHFGASRATPEVFNLFLELTNPIFGSPKLPDCLLQLGKDGVA